MLLADIFNKSLNVVKKYPHEKKGKYDYFTVGHIDSFLTFCYRLSFSIRNTIDLSLLLFISQY